MVYLRQTFRPEITGRVNVHIGFPVFSVGATLTPSSVFGRPLYHRMIKGVKCRMNRRGRESCQVFLTATYECKPQDSVGLVCGGKRVVGFFVTVIPHASSSQVDSRTQTN